MIVKTSESLDWEPVTIDFRVHSDGKVIDSELQSVVDKWFEERSERLLCQNGCSTKFVLAMPADTGVRLLAQWVCEKCLPRLLDSIALAFPQIEEARVGEFPEKGNIKSEPASIIQVSRRLTTMEDGRDMVVEAFRISSRPISIADYEKFCQESGHVTVAEREQRWDTFRRNGYLTGIEPAKRAQFEARFLSFDDAVAYCEYTGVRLPTDEEFLTAITIDDDHHEISAAEARALWEAGRIPRPASWTWTATHEGVGVVARCGPWFAKQPGWEVKMPPYRMIFDRSVSGPQFFVVFEG